MRRVWTVVLVLCLVALSCSQKSDNLTKPTGPSEQAQANVIMSGDPAVSSFPEDEEGAAWAGFGESWAINRGRTPTPSVPYRVRYSGMLKNTGDATAYNVRVIFTFYDSAGQVIGVDQSWCVPLHLSPGTVGTFSQEWGCSIGYGFSNESPAKEYSSVVSWDT